MGPANVGSSKLNPLDWPSLASEFQNFPVKPIQHHQTESKKKHYAKFNLKQQNLNSNISKNKIYNIYNNNNEKY